MAKSKKDTSKDTKVEKTVEKTVEKEEVVESPKDGVTKVTRPKSAYILFCNKYREQVKQDNQGAAPKIVLTKLGELWQEFKKENNDEYKEFVRLADEEKTAYNSLTKDSKKIVTKKKTDSEKKEKKPKAKKAESGDEKEKKPRAPNGYMNYLKGNREEYKKEFPDYTSKQVVKGLAERWKALDDGQKNNWKNGNL